MCSGIRFPVHKGPVWEQEETAFHGECLAVCKVNFLKQEEGYTEDLNFYYTGKCWQLYSGCCSVNVLKATNKDCNSTFVRAYILERKKSYKKIKKGKLKKPGWFNEHFPNTPWGVFALCSEAVTAAHLEATLTQPGQVRKATNLWEWAQTAMSDERDEQVCSKIFTRCIPWDWMFVCCPCQNQCWTHITCRNVWDLDFKHWVVPWVFSLLNGLTLTQITVLSLQNMWLHMQRMAVGTGDLFWVCCCSQHREDQSLLWMWTGRNSTDRDTQEKPLENWHWAQCLFPGICEESHLEEVDRPSFTFLKLFFKKAPVMKYRSQMCYRNQLDKKS